MSARAYADGADDDDSDIGLPDLDSIVYYAVHRGRYASSCVFLRWSDAEPHVQDFDDAEYERFDDVDNAVLFALFGSVEGGGAGGRHSGGLGPGEKWDVPEDEEEDEEEEDRDDEEEEKKTRRMSPRGRKVAAAAKKSAAKKPAAKKPAAAKRGRKKRASKSDIPDEDEDEYLIKNEEEEEDAATTPTGRKRKAFASKSASPKPKKPKAERKSGGGGRPRKRQTEPTPQWVEMYERLRAIRDVTGSIFIDPSDDDNVDLRKWVNLQRYNLRRSLKMYVKTKEGGGIKADEGGEDAENAGDADDEDQDQTAPSPVLMDKVRRLEELGIELRGDDGSVADAIPGNQWLSMLERLKLHREETGKFEIDPDDETKADLRKWFDRQVRELRNCRTSEGGFVYRRTGEPSASLANKARRLEALGYELPEGGRGDPENIRRGKPGRRPLTAASQEWMAMYYKLLAHKEQTGSIFIDYEGEDNNAIRRWWNHNQFLIRSEIKKAGGEDSDGEGVAVKLPPHWEEKARLLEVLDENVRGGTRGIHHPSRFGEMVERYLEYKADHGGKDLPCRSNDLNTAELIRWGMRQRQEYVKLQKGEKTKLTARNMQRLTDAGFQFKPSYRPRVSWEGRLDQLRQFKADHGHMKVPSRHPVVGEFVRQKRKEYNKYMTGQLVGHVIESQIRDLAEIGFLFDVGRKWTPPATSKPWEVRFRELLEFRAQHGHCLVPKSHPGLGQWVKQQRSQYSYLKKGGPSRLSPEKVIQLTDVGFVWDASSKRGEGL
uniref:Helicase-associated domain-containing protein n=1 Tax=Odontella aurita TaxID=265563 RepID=A0A7S4MM60_9STRA|mmetsp:Transcript_25620/g.75623  ORF Transcript_25620/g.75623 Transcript_25620/m.75623 type:complete len:771 (+) Transcript_25620:181-2493(+)